jgi:hypothetical protein
MNLIKIYAIFLLLTYSCSPNKNHNISTINLIESKNNNKIKENDEVFFLGFKPDFSQDQFLKQLKIENEMGNIKNNIFSISVDYWLESDGVGASFNEVLDFNLSYRNKMLFLDYKEIDINFPLQKLTRKLSNSFNNYIIIKDSLENLLNKKYEFNNQLHPNLQSNSTKFQIYNLEYLKEKIKNLFISLNLTQDNYLIYQNPNKTVLFGFTFKGHKNETGFKEVNDSLNFFKINSPVEYEIGEKIFLSSLNAYKKIFSWNENSTFIPDNYSIPIFKKSESYSKILIKKNKIANLLNDLARLKSYKSDSLHFFYDLQFIYMGNSNFKRFEQNLKNEYSKIVDSLIKKEELKISNHYLEKQNKGFNKTKL